MQLTVYKPAATKTYPYEGNDNGQIHRGGLPSIIYDIIRIDNASYLLRINHTAVNIRFVGEKSLSSCLARALDAAR